MRTGKNMHFGNCAFYSSFFVCLKHIEQYILIRILTTVKELLITGNYIKCTGDTACTVPITWRLFLSEP
jgi:hypothetical protein